MPSPPKPIAIWAAQGYLFLFGLAGMWGLMRTMASLQAPAIDILWGACVTFAALVTLVGIERRSSWARWLGGAQVGLLFVGLALKDVGRYTASERSAFDRGQLGGGLLVSSLALLLAWRVVFSEPARAYFAGKPVSGQSG